MTDETLFAAALEQPGPVERSAYLDNACGADTAQRKRIDALLAAHDKAGAFLERPVVAAPDPSRAPTRAFRDPAKAAGDDTATGSHGGISEEDADDALGFLAPPTRPDSLGRIGHYEVLEVLGHGGFGIVYRAFDEVLQRVVAVKVLAPSLATTSPARKRFLREAQSAAPIRHENVVRIHEIGEQPLPHLVMEFIPGETLQHKLDRTGPLDIAEIVRVGRQVAEGLAAAHANGLIHRDIKPSNILIDSGPEARVKITDFGLARAADDASLTRSGTVAGTPMYMAPEQAKGESLDHRADLFSLGSVLYVMGTGRPPFRAETTLAVLKRVAEEDPRPIREIIPEVPEWLCRIVEKLHAKDPAERFQSASEVADVLADCERQLSTHREVKDTSLIPEGKAKPCSNRLRLLVSPGILLLLLAIVTFAVWAGPLMVLYPANQGRITLVGPPDPDFEKMLVWRNGELVATLDPTSPQVGLPARDYELEAVCVEGYEATKFHVDTRLLYMGGISFERVEGRPAIRLTLRRGESITVEATAERRRAPLLPPPSGKDSWVPLFNGKDLTGWTPSAHSQGQWRVEGGELVGKQGPGYLFAAKPYENFHLRVEVQINATGNSGISFRQQFQAEIRDDPPCPTGSLLEVTPAKTTTLARYPKSTPTDTWFTLEVRAEGAILTSRINDGPWVTAQDTRPPGSRAGPLQLEVFDPNTIVRFRKIEIQEISTNSATAQVREELAKLNGEWVVRQARVDQSPLLGSELVEKRLSLHDGKFVLPIRADDGYPWALTGTYDLDETKKRLTFKFKDQDFPVPCAYRVEGDRLILDFPEPKIGDGETGSTEPFVPDVRLATQQNLKTMGMAIHNFVAKNNDTFPSAAIVHHGKPLLSWRVALLPHLGQDELYKQFKLDQSWDSEHNKTLIAKMPQVFAIPGITTPPGQTHYRVFVGDDTAFELRPAGAKGIGFGNFEDGLAGTILVTEAAESVIWTKPDDFPYDPKTPLPKLGVYASGPHMVMGDGSVIRLLPQATEKGIRGAIVRNEGDVLSPQHLYRIPMRGPAVHLELQRRASLPAGAVLLRSFDPAKDKPVPMRGDASKIIRVEDGAWRIENKDEGGNFRVALTTITDGIPEDGILVCRAKVKLQSKHKDAWGSLELNAASPSFHGYDWPDHLARYQGEIADWAEKEVRYPVEAIRKKNPPTITVYIGLHADGVLWVKDVELLHIPPPGKAAAPPRPAPRPTLLKAFDPAKATAEPLRGDAKEIVSVENGAWRIENALDRSVSGNFRIALGTIVDGIPEDGFLIFRAKIKLQPKSKNAWGELDLNATSASSHGYDWPDHLARYQGEITEWTEKELRYPVEIIRKKNPPTVTLHVGLHDNGVLWVKDVELLHVPATPKPPAKPKPPAPPLAVVPFDGTKAKEYQDAWAAHLGVPVEIDNSVGMKLRLVAPGTFLMGSTQKDIDDLLGDAKETERFLVHAEGPRRTVQITSPFYMGRYEVTQTEYFRVMGVNPSDFALTGKAAAKVKGVDTDRFPVEMVTWDDAESFCRKLSARPEEVAAGRSYRLPTEAEWEYACRAGTATRFHTGDALAATDANFELTIGRPQPVGSFPANAFGLHDMHGNVFEWCGDWYADSYRDLPATDPQGADAGDARVVRGGNYGYKDRYCRSAARDRFQPIARRGGIGFRVVVVIAQKPQPPVKGLDPAVLQPLKDVVAAKMQVRDLARVRFDVGVAGRIELLQAEAGLTESRITLAEAEGSSAVVVTLLEEMVKFRQEERDLIAIRVEAGADRQDVLSQADARLGEAQARLAKVKPMPEIAPAPRRKP